MQGVCEVQQPRTKTEGSRSESPLKTDDRNVGMSGSSRSELTNGTRGRLVGITIIIQAWRPRQNDDRISTRSALQLKKGRET